MELDKRKYIRGNTENKIHLYHGITTAENTNKATKIQEQNAPNINMYQIEPTDISKHTTGQKSTDGFENLLHGYPNIPNL